MGAGREDVVCYAALERLKGSPERDGVEEGAGQDWEKHLRRLDLKTLPIATRKCLLPCHPPTVLERL